MGGDWAKVIRYATLRQVNGRQLCSGQTQLDTAVSFCHEPDILDRIRHCSTYQTKDGRRHSSAPLRSAMSGRPVTGAAPLGPRCLTAAQHPPAKTPLGNRRPCVHRRPPSSSSSVPAGPLALTVLATVPAVLSSQPDPPAQTVPAYCSCCVTHTSRVAMVTA